MCQPAETEPTGEKARGPRTCGHHVSTLLANIKSEHDVWITCIMQHECVVCRHHVSMTDERVIKLAESERRQGTRPGVRTSHDGCQEDGHHLIDGEEWRRLQLFEREPFPAVWPLGLQYNSTWAIYQNKSLLRNKTHSKMERISRGPNRAQVHKIQWGTAKNVPVS